MGIADLTPGRSTVALSAALAHRPPARAVIAEAPSTPDGPLLVYLPDVSQTDLVGPCKWSADRGTTLPAVGANALVVWDNTGAPVIVWWQGEPSGTTLIDGGRIGSTMSWTGTTLPDDYVVADGRTLVGTDYPDAYAFAQVEAAAGNPLWTADTGAGTFTVPDLSDKFIYGPGALSLGDTGGESTHILTPAETAMKAHNHGGVTGNENANHNHNYTFPVTWATINGGSFTNVAAVGGTTTTGVENQNHGHAIPSETAADGTAHNNMPPYVVLAQLVKVLGVTITAGALRGPAGADGVDGADGADGAQGPVGNPPITFRGERTTDVTLASGYNWPIAFDEQSDSDGFYSGSRFQPTKAGYYRLSASVTLSGLASGALPEMYLLKNATSATATTATSLVSDVKGARSDGWLGLSVTDLVYCNGTTDYVDVAVWSPTASVALRGTAAEKSSFSGESVGAAGPTGPTGSTGPAGTGAVPVVTSLPASPGDGQECLYEFTQTVNPVDAKPTYWHLRYNATAAAWYPVGLQEPVLAWYGPQEGTSFGAGTWGNISAHDPEVTLPLGGDYQIDYGNGAGLSPAGNNSWLGLKIAGVDPTIGNERTTTNAMTTSQWGPAGQGSYKLVGAAASTTVQMRYQLQTGSGNITRVGAWIKAYPRKITP